MPAPAMRGPITLFAVFVALYVITTATRRLFLSGVLPIADEEVPQSIWLLTAAFLIRALENIALLGLTAMLLIALTQWVRTVRFRRPGG
jgi:hypothetical protein